jgi:hypothetical protein
MDGAILMPCSDSTAQIGSTPHLSREESALGNPVLLPVVHVALGTGRPIIDAGN